MKSSMMLLAAVAFFPISARGELGDALAGLESKLCRPWQGLGPCDGQLMLQSDHTFQRRHYGPGFADLEGTWTLDWTELPPILTLRCTASSDQKMVGQTKPYAIGRLNDSALEIKLVLEGHQTNPLRYEPIRSKAASSSEND